MSATLRPARVRRDSAHEGRVVRAAASDLGLTVATTGQLVRQMGIHRRVAILIRHAVQQGDLALAERLFAPIEAARMAFAPEPVTAELIASEERADALEGIAEVSYLANPTRENRRTWISALRMQRARSLELLVALEVDEAPVTAPRIVV